MKEYFQFRTDGTDATLGCQHRHRTLKAAADCYDLDSQYDYLRDGAHIYSIIDAHMTMTDAGHSAYVPQQRRRLG